MDRRVDIIWTVDGKRHLGYPWLKAMVFSEQIEALEQCLGSPVAKIALDTDTNVVWRHDDCFDPDGLTACIDGVVYDTCGDVNCSGWCERQGPCSCICHQV